MAARQTRARSATLFSNTSISVRVTVTRQIEKSSCSLGALSKKRLRANPISGMPREHPLPPRSPKMLIAQITRTAGHEKIVLAAPSRSAAGQNLPTRPPRP
ncbi:hypothetical protein TcG_02097 [Trypanosoma cruzi]|nr:hypothetical protein TcG_02097 [Trypanosoma cruzi]